MNVCEFFRTLVAAPEVLEVASAGGSERRSWSNRLLSTPHLVSDNYFKVCAPLEKFLRTPMLGCSYQSLEWSEAQQNQMTSWAHSGVVLRAQPPHNKFSYLKKLCFYMRNF